MVHTGLDHATHLTNRSNHTNIFRLIRPCLTTGYRPLTLSFTEPEFAFFSTAGLSPYLWFAVVSFIVGSMAVCLFLVARPTPKRITAILSVFLLLCSPPCGTGWLIFSGIHALVLLLICLGLLFYNGR